MPRPLCVPKGFCVRFVRFLRKSRSFMINPEKRKAIYLLYENGMPIRDISRQLRVNRNTVRSIIKQRGIEPETARDDRIQIDSELLYRLYGECEGFIRGSI